MPPGDNMSPYFSNLTSSSDLDSPTTHFMRAPSSDSLVSTNLATTAATGLRRPSTQQIASSRFCQALGRRSVLLVDDDAQVGRALTLILGRDCIRLMTAVSVAEAVEMQSAFGDEIGVILTILGPTGQALDLLAARRHVGHRAPVIVLKAAQDQEGWAAATRAGAATFVDYPINPTELRSVIMRVC